jgi:hypothetical protein
MVTFNNAGRMGNWMFEFAASAAYALKHGIEFTVPASTKDLKWNPIYCPHLINPNYKKDLPQVHLWENGHHYQELPFEEYWRDQNIIVEGYRQSEKYFKGYRSEILYLLGFPYQMKEGYVAIHVRRGDYLHLRNKHPEVTKQWYEMAMALFPGYKFKFFSDDISWCRSEFGERQDCEFSTNASEEQDMIEASHCEHSIISASTFGWWIAWLNQNQSKKVYIPRLWFIEGYSLDTKDIIPDEWIKL